jgi:alpha-ketoglutarate-dependent 2,4-dichlorophenoxyacetate dioxygenase
MTLEFRKLTPVFGAEVTRGGQPLDLRQVHDRETLDAINAGMDQYAVLLFRRQPLTDVEQTGFGERLDGGLLGKSVYGGRHSTKQLANSHIRDISNVDEKGEIMRASDKRRVYQLSNRLWHTDASFREPAGHYSLLSARVVPPVRADTEFADMRAAWDELDEDLKQQVAGLKAHHSIAYSRQMLGFEFTPEELESMKGAVQPLVNVNPRTGRKALYIAWHITRILDMPLPEGRLLLNDLMAHATQPKFTYCHQWQQDDLVIWDNTSTMHRGRAYDDARYKREMRRLTTVEVRAA